MVLWCQHCVQGRSDVQQDFDRVFVLPDFCGLQSLIPHRLPRYERLDCILQPCLHHCNDFSMHTSCSILGQNQPGFKCFKNEPWWISYATTQISTDFALLLMPIPQIMTLSMGRAEKLGICLVFGTGALYVLLQLSRHALTRTASPLHPSIVPLRLPHQRATPTLLGGQFLPLSGPLSRPTPVLSAPVYPCFAVLSLDSSVQSLVGHEGQ